MGKSLSNKERRDRSDRSRKMRSKKHNSDKAKAKRAAEREVRRQEREKWKGRKSLMGLDLYGLQAALDEIADGKVKCPLEPRAYQDSWPVYEVFLPWRYSSSLWIPCLESNTEDHLQGKSVAFVRLVYCPARVRELIEKYCSHQNITIRRIGILVRTTNGREVKQEAVYPAEFALTLFAAIWPDCWHHFAQKYFDAYTPMAVKLLEGNTSYANALAFDERRVTDSFLRELGDVIGLGDLLYDLSGHLPNLALSQPAGESSD